MRVICDIETDDLNATVIWWIVCKDIDTNELYSFYRPDLDSSDFGLFADKVTLWIGHNFLVFDREVINRLVKGVNIDASKVIDTFICSKLFNYGMDGGHSLDAWGKRLGRPKLEFNEFVAYSDVELEKDRLERCRTYCEGDVELNYLLFKFLEKHIYSNVWKKALRLEHDVALLCKRMNTNGFYFDIQRCEDIFSRLTFSIRDLERRIQSSFRPKARPVKQITPRITKMGTLNASDFRWLGGGDLSAYSEGAEFTRIEWEDFNPGSPRQIVERFNEFGWKPINRTKGHLDFERNRRTYEQVLDPTSFKKREKNFSTYGWSIDEVNLETLPKDAPEEAWLLVEWRMLDKRRQVLEEWKKAYNERTHRIHANFNSIGTWTHRKSHSDPNMGNVPSIDSKYNSKRLKELAYEYGKEMRSCFTVPKGRRLIGVDADSIQLRGFAHYIEDKEFTNALVNGNKEDGTDAHTLNAIKLGIGKERRPNAKTFIYAFLLGAGVDKTAKILDYNKYEAEEAIDKFIRSYPGLVWLREKVLPADKDRGHFIGLDGRLVVLPKYAHPGTILGGYLQNFESLVMKKAQLEWTRILDEHGVDYLLVDDVHDEWQTETVDDDEVANFVMNTQMQSIANAGEYYKVKCPLLGTGSQGYTWYDTH